MVDRGPARQRRLGLAELEEILLLIDQADRWPVELGFQEESTVPDVG